MNYEEVENYEEKSKLEIYKELAKALEEKEMLNREYLSLKLKLYEKDIITNNPRKTNGFEFNEELVYTVDEIKLLVKKMEKIGKHTELDYSFGDFELVGGCEYNE